MGGDELAGTLVVRVYTSKAMVPVSGAAVAVTQANGGRSEALLAVRLTNVDGYTEAISIETPIADGVTITQNGQQPYTTVNVTVEQVGYDRVLVENTQVFSGVQTVQEVQLIPTSQLPQEYGRTETYVIPPQTLDEEVT